MPTWAFGREACLSGAAQARSSVAWPWRWASGARGRVRLSQPSKQGASRSAPALARAPQNPHAGGRFGGASAAGSDEAMLTRLRAASPRRAAFASSIRDATYSFPNTSSAAIRLCGRHRTRRFDVSSAPPRARGTRWSSSSSDVQPQRHDDPIQPRRRASPRRRLHIGQREASPARKRAMHDPHAHAHGRGDARKLSRIRRGRVGVGAVAVGVGPGDERGGQCPAQVQHLLRGRERGGAGG